MKKLLYFSSFFTVSLSVAAAQSTYHSPQFFVEAQAGVNLSVVLAPVFDGSGVTFGKSDLQMVATDNPDVERPSNVKLRFKVASDSVVLISPTVFFGEYDRSDPSMSNMRQQALSTHSFKVNDILSFPELAQLGVKLNYRLVSAQPDQPYRPRLESKVPALAFEFSQIDRLMGRITIHNQSNSAVVAFEIDNGNGAGEMPQPAPGRGLIAPGSTFEFDFSRPRYRCIEGVCGTEQLPLILRDAVFEDGSYMGDPKDAMQQSAHWLGRAAEWKRIVSAARPIVSNPDLDEAEKIDSLDRVLQELSIEPDGDIVANFRMRFSDLSASEIHRGGELLAMAMRNERNDVESHLRWRKEDIDHKSRFNNIPPLADWWAYYAGN
ncbi:MAG: hypothetical protein WBQ94_15615 [Terracidiphilus sp.]